MPKKNGITTAESCKFCSDSEDVSYIISGYVAKGSENREDNISVSAFIHEDLIIISANHMTLKATINFCPMCGRKFPNSKDEYDEEYDDDDDDECESKCGHDCENANECEYECENANEIECECECEYECECDCENECDYNELKDLLYAQALRHMLNLKQL